MADDGSAPRGHPPPRPSSRSPSPPQDDSPPKSAAQGPAARLAATAPSSSSPLTGWEEIANRLTTGGAHGTAGPGAPNYVGPFSTRDGELDQLRRMLKEYRDENDALGEAVTAMRAALEAEGAAKKAAEEARDAAVAERGAAEAARDEAKAAHAQSQGSLAAAEVELTRTRATLDDVEQLAVDLQDDLAAARAAASEAASRAADDRGAAETAAEERVAAQAMAAELRDRIAHLERDAEVRASQLGIAEGLEVALAEARSAATSAATDRDTLAASWRREWEAAKEDHAAELRSARARIAAVEGDLAMLRDRLRVERTEHTERRRELEAALAEARLDARRAKSDQNGAAESLRLMVAHEDVLREAARHQAELVGRLRMDAAGSAARCERVAGHCAALMRERDLAVHRAEAAEAAEARAREEAQRAWGHPMAPLARALNQPGNPSSGRPDDISTLLAAAVRQSRSSPRSFAAGMAGGDVPRGGDGGGGGSTPSSAAASPESGPEPSGAGSGHGAGVAPPPSTPASGGTRWIESIGLDVAEELVHALAREVAEARTREAQLREELADARDKRDDAQRALQGEVHRVHDLERMRVADLRELHAAEQRARAATSSAWGLRDKLALVTAQQHVLNERTRRGDEGGNFGRGDRPREGDGRAMGVGTTRAASREWDDRGVGGDGGEGRGRDNVQRERGAREYPEGGSGWEDRDGPLSHDDDPPLSLPSPPSGSKTREASPHGMGGGSPSDRRAGDEQSLVNALPAARGHGATHGAREHGYPPLHHMYLNMQPPQPPPPRMPVFSVF